TRAATAARRRKLWRAFAACVAIVFTGAVPAQDNAPRVLTVAAVGDIMLGGTAEPELRRFGYDYPFERVAPLLRAADLAFGNLEGPLTHRGVAHAKQYVFRSPPEQVAPALARAGFDF